VQLKCLESSQLSEIIRSVCSGSLKGVTGVLCVTRKGVESDMVGIILPLSKTVALALGTRCVALVFTCKEHRGDE